MGTRSLTTFIQPYKDKNGKQKKVKLVTMYRQYDGYPSGHGIQLADFLAGGTMVDGFALDEKRLEFNGMGCLAAQAIAHFKKGVGGFYLEPVGAKDCWEEYRYEVIGNGAGQEVTLRCYDVYASKWIFEGTPKEFISTYSKFKETA
jgi:hypothetical protein